MKTYISFLIMGLVLLVSCSSENTEKQVVDLNDNVSRISEEKLVGADCVKLSEETQLSLVEKNTNENISFDFLGAIYDEGNARCLLKVKINNSETPNTPVYSLLNIVTQRTQKTFSSLEEMEAEILTLGGNTEVPSSQVSATGSDINDIEKSFEEQRQASEGLDFLGLSEAEAEALAQENGVPFRVVSRDGEALPVTMDYRPGRINAEITDGVVSSFSVE